MWAPPVLWNSRLYVPVASFCDVPPFKGKLVELNTVTATEVAAFYPTGRSGPVSGGGIWGMAGASIDQATSAVWVATGNAVFDPESFRHAEHVVGLTRNLRVVASHYPGVTGFDADFGGSPLLYRPPGCPPLVAVKNKYGRLFLYDRSSPAAFNAGPIQSIQMASADSMWFQNIPAYDPVRNKVYVSNSSDSTEGTYLHGLVALDVLEDCTLGLAWQYTVGPLDDVVPPPSAANGVVYYADAAGDGTGPKLFALNAQTGQKLWDSGSLFQSRMYAAPIVVNGRVYIAGTDGFLYAFGL